MRLVPGNPDKPTVSAYITFTSADSCDHYYDKYPNGFDVRQQGKKWPVIVNKKDGVDVVSGMLQGYLDCGATRVVKVSNADDDWGVVALNKLAKGKNSAWQVEAVQDTYHGGVSQRIAAVRGYQELTLTDCNRLESSPFASAISATPFNSKA
jgi:hypothetical protein